MPAPRSHAAPVSPLSSRSSWPSPASSSSWRHRPRRRASRPRSRLPYSQDWSTGLITQRPGRTSRGWRVYRGDDLAAATSRHRRRTLTARGRGVRPHPSAVTPNTSAPAASRLPAVRRQDRSRSAPAALGRPRWCSTWTLTGKTGIGVAYDARTSTTALTTSPLGGVAVPHEHVGGLHQHSWRVRHRCHDRQQRRRGLHPRVGHAAGRCRQPVGRLRARHHDRQRHGSNEHIGIDNIAITAGGAPAPLALANPGSQSSNQGIAISTLQLSATGGTPPYTYGATGLPPGLTLNAGNGADHRHAEHHRRQSVHRQRDCAPTARRPARTTRTSRGPSTRPSASRRSRTSRAPAPARRSPASRVHRGRGDRVVPDRWPQRLLHPDSRCGHRRTRPTRSSSTAAPAASRRTRRSVTPST